MSFLKNLKAYHFVFVVPALVVLVALTAPTQLRINRLELAAAGWVPIAAEVDEVKIRYRQGTITYLPTVSYVFEGTAYASKLDHWMDSSLWENVYEPKNRWVGVVVNPDEPSQFDFVSGEILRFYIQKRNQSVLFVGAVLTAIIGIEIAMRFRR